MSRDAPVLGGGLSSIGGGDAATDGGDYDDGDDDDDLFSVSDTSIIYFRSFLVLLH